MSDQPATIWIFGCFGRLAGHFYAGCVGPQTSVDPPNVDTRSLVGRYRCIDEPEGALCPVSDATPTPYGDWPPAPAGWSVVRWFDRQGPDPRTGGFTAIVAQGSWTDVQLVAAARRLAPWAIRVPLGGWADVP